VQLPALGLQGLAQLLCLGQAQHGAIHGKAVGLGAPARGRTQVQLLQPLHTGGHDRAIEFDQVDASAGQLGFGLFPIAAVGEQGCLARRHEQRARRAREAAQPLSPLPVFGQVFRQVRVAAGQQCGLPALAGQAGAQRSQAGRDGRRKDGSVGCVHGGAATGVASAQDAIMLPPNQA
jgi:hypothetical protein